MPHRTNHWTRGALRTLLKMLRILRPRQFNRSTVFLSLAREMDNQFKSNSGEVKLSGVKSDIRPVTGERRTCLSFWCNYSTNEPLAKCPKCRQPLLVAQTFKLLGLVLAFCGGLFVIGATSLIILFTLKLPDGKGITEGVVLFIYGILGLFLIVGLTIMTAGISQTLSGKRSQKLMTLFIILLIVFAITASIGKMLFYIFF